MTKQADKQKKRSAASRSHPLLGCGLSNRYADPANPLPSEPPASLVPLGAEGDAGYHRLWEAICDRYSPRDAHEVHLVRRIAECAWRLERAAALESAALDFTLASMRADIDKRFEKIGDYHRLWLAWNELSGKPGFTALAREESAALHSLRDALSELTSARGKK